MKRVWLLKTNANQETFRVYSLLSLGIGAGECSAAQMQTMRSPSVPWKGLDGTKSIVTANEEVLEGSARLVSLEDEAQLGPMSDSPRLSSSFLAIKNARTWPCVLKV